MRAGMPMTKGKTRIAFSLVSPLAPYKAVKAVIKPKITPGALASARGKSRFSLKSP